MVDDSGSIGVTSFARRNGRALACALVALATACGKTDGNPDPTTTAGSSGTGAGAGGADDGGRGGSSAGNTTTAGAAGTTEPPARVTSDQLDLLLMVDNSISMADKQQLLQSAVPMLVERLVRPRCIGANGEPTGSTVDADGACAAGIPEIRPLSDVHIGVITSSLGAHGGQVCVELDDDDHARLVPSVRPDATVPTWKSSGFLAWDPGATPSHDPPGEQSADRLVSNFQGMLATVGDRGCGYESSLEAWYRFLIDPDPPSAVGLVTDPSTGLPLDTQAVFDPPDAALLAQRAAFLRPNSTVAIVMLTDENDCSIRDEGQSWLVGLTAFPPSSPTPYFMPRATSACAANPNDECCQSCDAAPGTRPARCGSAAADPECAKGKYTSLEDNVGLRCFDQKRRFGFDLLYPIERYVEGLTAPRIPSRRIDASGNPILVQNPLYAGTPPRSTAQVFLAGILGVPWQDLATPDSLEGPGLEYLTYAELTAADRWSLVLGSEGDATTAPTPPRDALMIETSLDRSTLDRGPHPLLGVPIAPPTAASDAHPVNGHESAIADGTDLQYACTFPLAEPRACDGSLLSCDCDLEEAQYSRSLCQGTTQTHAKAYPSVRPLRVLKAFGERTHNAVVASICPKSIDPASPIFGYAPAIDALLERLNEGLEKAALD